MPSGIDGLDPRQVARSGRLAGHPAELPRRRIGSSDPRRRHDERFKMLREGAAVAGLEFFQPLAPVAAQRLISGYALAPAPRGFFPGRLSDAGPQSARR